MDVYMNRPDRGPPRAMYTPGVRMALTDTWLEADDGKERAVLAERSDREGLGVRISPKGKITFQLRYRYDGKPKRLDLGSYPLMSLKEARTEAHRLRARREQGHDSQVVRLLAKQAIITADSVERFFRHWYDAYCQEPDFRKSLNFSIAVTPAPACESRGRRTQRRCGRSRVRTHRRCARCRTRSHAPVPPSLR